MILLAQDYDYTAYRRQLCWDVFFEGGGCQLPLGTPSFSLTIFVACLLCFLATLFALHAVRTNRPIVIKEAQYIPSELMNYTLPYVVSFMNLDYEETGKFVGIVIFLGWMFWITYKSGQLIMNPLLFVFGWRHYEVTYNFPGDDTEYNGSALAKGAIAMGERRPHASVQDVLIMKANDNGS